MAGKKGMDHYPVEMKLEAVRLFFEEGRTHAEITQKLGIRSSTRVKVWVRQFRRPCPYAPSTRGCVGTRVRRTSPTGESSSAG